jgi:uncharacterized membrane protein
MEQGKTSPEDHVLNRIVSWVLLLGLASALVLMCLGAILGLLSPTSLVPHTTAPRDLLNGLLHGAPVAFMSLGLMILLATPAMRVLVLLLGYLQRRRWLFAAIALLVLAVLAVSVVVGLQQ